MELEHEKYGAGDYTAADSTHARAWDNIAANARLRCKTQDTNTTTKVSTPMAPEIKEYLECQTRMQKQLERIQDYQMEGRGDKIPENVNYPRPTMNGRLDRVTRLQ